MTSDYLYRILKARVYDVAIETPLEPAPRLSKRFGNTVLFKREDLQPVFSFKLRGAYNKLIQIPKDELARGVICASAGNHAQGVALAARELDVRSVVVMPESTPTIKIRAVEALGGKVILDGATYDDAYARAVELAKNDDLVFIHPFDDPEVIAGQGTIGMEIHRQQKGKIDAVFVPVGGGGLIAGIALYIKALSPETKVIGVEPNDSASMTAALQAGKPVTLSDVGIFADGVAVRRVGDETFRICKEHVDEIVLVDNDEICAAVQDIFEDTRAIVEPAGALAVAGMKRYIETNGVEGETLVTVNCGANINFDRLRHIAERAALGEQREALLAVEIPEKPGSFVAFCEAIGQRNLTEFNYRYHDQKTARIFVGIELSRGRDEKNEIIERLKKQGYPVIDITDNEMAKLHIRHMVGGYAVDIDDECLYRFEFPERRGALLAFLKAIGHRWNISLFHYRNHGSDYGRVLAGVQVPESEREEFDQHLRDLGYRFEDESDNPAYKMFLAE
ncbi:MAG: threonine ammonia-lyase, biosynthetic [Gammaproteobacteria bacterium]|nr:threonine ammonia-lyase, biosynthetic [Gammaproteobacteria bacterium]MBT8444089.1 threonine ammonia-lyase, biosynthetic [Gammaproteobacteria bacterium]NND36401.1 threonine ammonia-lyase, biosynthetic [Gammaproteobacteria bacterium]